MGDIRIGLLPACVSALLSPCRRLRQDGEFETCLIKLKKEVGGGDRDREGKRGSILVSFRLCRLIWHLYAVTRNSQKQFFFFCFILLLFITRHAYPFLRSSFLLLAAVGAPPPQPISTATLLDSTSAWRCGSARRGLAWHAYEALGSSPRLGVVVHTCYPSTGEVEAVGSGVQSHPWLYIKSKAYLG